MDIDEPRTLKLADMQPRGHHKHLCKVCAKNFRSGRALGGHMSCHRHAGMEASSNSNGDHQHNVMLFSPVKRKRSKRGMPALDSEVCAAAALLMLAEYSDKSSAFEDCYGGDNNDNIATPNLLKEVDLNTFDQTVQCDEFMNNTRPKSDKNSAYASLYDISDKENSLNLASDVPRQMLPLNVFDHGLVDGHSETAEFMKPEAGISVEEVKCGNLSVAANIKRYQCKVCRKLLRSWYALGVHMRLHLEKENSLNLVTDVPKKEVLLDVFDPGLDVDAEFVKPGAGNLVEDLKFSELSAAVNIKSYPCKVCGKLLKSERALGGHMTSHLHHGQENTLNLVADIPKTEVVLNVSDHGLDADAEFMKSGAYISVEELKSSDLSAPVNVKRRQCKVSGKLLGSELTLGGHVRLHYVRKCKNLQQGVVDCPNSGLMEEHMQKLELDSPIFCRHRPSLHGSIV